MGYWIDCTCGNEIEVSAGQAGCEVTCKCGKVLNVPSLSELRAQSGEHAASPELVVATLYGSGERTVGNGSCILCDTETPNRMNCSIECEKPWVQGDHGLGFWLIAILVFGVYGLIYSMIHRKGERLVEARTHRVVVSLCANCLKTGLDERSLKNAIRRDPDVARLLHKYPSARLLYKPAASSASP
jgi:hypothetical protein